MSEKRGPGQPRKYVHQDTFEDWKDSEWHPMKRKVNEIHQAIAGYNGKGGILDDIETNKKKINRNTILLIAIVSSGVFGVGITGIVNLLT